MKTEQRSIDLTKVLLSFGVDSKCLGRYLENHIKKNQEVLALLPASGTNYEQWLKFSMLLQSGIDEVADREWEFEDIDYLMIYHGFDPIELKSFLKSVVSDERYLIPAKQEILEELENIRNQWAICQIELLSSFLNWPHKQLTI